MPKSGLKGAKAHAARLKKLTGETMIREVGKALFAAGEMVQTEAQISITAGAVSGKNHKPSAPGKPPNNESGVLAGNIETVQAAPLVVEVSSNAPYAAIHEFGGTIKHPGGTPYFMRDGKAVFVGNSGYGAFHTLPKTKPHDIEMPARPYMGPARDAKRKEVTALVQKAVNRAVKRSKSGDT
ncbi:MAG: phage virion morphogenesis protein [Novosphingobium sp.]